MWECKGRHDWTAGGNISVKLNRAKFTRSNVYHILVGGLPNFSRQGITSVAAVLLNMVAARYGEETIAALTVSTRIASLAYMIMIGWGQGFQPICAMNYGAKQYERVKTALKITIVDGTILRIQCLTLPLMCFYAASSMFMQNIGRYFTALWISICRQGICYIPLLLMLPSVIGKSGIYWVQPIADFISFLFSVIVMMTYFRKNKEVFFPR